SVREPLGIEWAHVAVARLGGVSKNQFEMWIRGDGRRGLGAERPDVDAFVNGFEQPGERCGALVHAGIIEPGFGIWDSGFGGLGIMGFAISDSRLGIPRR